MSGSVKFTINQIPVEAAKGTTLLAAARSIGVEIPTYCQHDDLEGYGACRLCVVEVKKGRSTKVVASCLYPVEEGIEVQTETDKIARHRRVILELMKAKWPNVPKALMEKYGVKEGRLVPNITFCILCGLCVRHCEDVKKASALGFIGRGVDRQVVTFPSAALPNCPDCVHNKDMQCFKVCPTGVISNDYACYFNYGPRGAHPIAHPIRMRDKDNEKTVKNTVGGK